MQGALTAGAYLRKRREAAGLSLSDIGCHLGPNRLSRPIELIELDVRVPSGPDITLLRTLFAFDLAVLSRLLCGDESDRICTGCGCTEWDPCMTSESACQWVAIDRCSACPSLVRNPELMV